MKWCAFVLRVMAMALVFAVMFAGLATAHHSNHMIDLVERDRVTKGEEVNYARMANYEIELVAQRNTGLGVMFLGGLLFVWSCIGLVRKGSPTRKSGVVAVSIMGVVFCYAAVQICVYTVRWKRVSTEDRERVKAMADIKIAQVYFEKGDWPRPYTNIVQRLESALKCPDVDDAWARGVLAEIYLSGRTGRQDLEKCRQHSEIAAQKGDARGRLVLERLEKGETDLPLEPELAIRDVTGIDVSAVQLNPKRVFAPPKMSDIFSRAMTFADGDGRIRRIHFIGGFPNGSTFTNGLERLDKLLSELSRRLDCEQFAVQDYRECDRWWVFRFTQTADWIMSVRLYNGRTTDGVLGPLFVTLEFHGREPDGRYSGSNCEFVHRPLTHKGM